MIKSDFYVTPSEFFAAVEEAFVKVYLAEDQKKYYEDKWHPEDLAINASAIMEAVGAYSCSVMAERVRAARGA